MLVTKKQKPKPNNCAISENLLKTAKTFRNTNRMSRPNQLYEAGNTLLLKPDKDSTRK